MIKLKKMGQNYLYGDRRFIWDQYGKIYEDMGTEFVFFCAMNGQTAKQAIIDELERELYA